MTMIDGGGGSVTDPTTVAEQRSSSSSLRTRPSDDDPAEPAIVLPGYELWDPTASGVEHSRQKLQHSSHQLTTKLGELTKSYRNSNSHKNKNSRNNSAIVRIVPCATEAATWNYRCRCNFQIILQQKTMGSHGNTTTTEFRYALRTHGQPITLGTHNTFPIATPQIQRAMRDVLDYFNNTKDNHRETKTTTAHHRMLTQYVTSCTFSSGWYDPDQKEVTTTTAGLCNCVLTLNYYCQATQPNDPASLSSSFLQHASHQRQWRTAATFLLQQLPGVQQINGRSKGIVLAVTKKKTDDDEDAEQGKTAIIRDTLHLIRYEPVPVPSTTMLPPSTSGTQVRESPTTLEFDVCLVPTAEEEYEKKPKEHSQPPPPRPEIRTSTGRRNRSVIIPVLYEKPETAFYHPNATVMLTALRWILNRLVWIRSHKSNNCNKSKNQNTHHNTLLKVLELYCGCGAHTIAMGKSGLVSHIEAIELEPHLVQACARNITVNALTSMITVERNDAGRWSQEATAAAARARRRQHGVGSSDTITADTTQENQPKYGYDVVLVDPPRQGLDDHVCRMVMLSTHDDDTSNSNSNSPNDHTDELDTANDEEKKQSRRSMFEHILYVSCGHQALLRDLERLSPVYEVIDCIQLVRT